MIVKNISEKLSMLRVSVNREILHIKYSDSVKNTTYMEFITFMRPVRTSVEKNMRKVIWKKLFIDKKLHSLHRLENELYKSLENNFDLEIRDTLTYYNYAMTNSSYVSARVESSVGNYF